MSDATRRYNQLSREELARRLVICERVRKHWRIIAAGCALGKWDIERVVGVCFQELIGHVPEDAVLDKWLKEITDEMEARQDGKTKAESIARAYGKDLRSIIAQDK